MSTLSELSRRDFIRSASGLAVSASLLNMAHPFLGIGKKKWPVGCRDLYLKVAGKPDSWSCMQELGAECTEVCVDINLACNYLFHPERKYSVATEDGIKALKADLACNGCRISAFMMSNHLDEQLDQEVAAARGLVKAAQELGVKAIRIDVVPRKLPAKSEEFLPFAIKACKQLCAVAEGTSVRFGVENHSTITNDPQFLARLFDGVGSDKLGLTLDCANFYWWGHPLNDLYDIYKQVAPRVVHTHCKSIRYPEDKKNIRRQMGWEYAKYNCPVYEGDIDFKRLVSILRKAKYQGDLCVEDESLDKYPAAERAQVMSKEIAMLKALA
jgi:sugar phosphate isomerase/epimerase